ncbi:GNAT family N-acetyltransferase [Alicyclobacillus sp. SO9]|uniref:GNAT family N-acetyltransferase n=1 Tax=Alicyclobacillus sp. SO9 TaxID=2665646 RepID=UPI0018E81E8B|nr:GNAT family N-acetyltransferase [Alicyclobacillus sp. SO9]QQE80371.1 GNAT family N-acetyltransferase [Alicyclobacillus sp. SO9]
MSESATMTLPNYFKRLNDYFPEQELKHPEQLEDLVKHASVYKKLEDEQFLILYAEFPNFLFVDYLLVSSKIRGKGIGTKVMKRLQSQGKPIVLEVEPEDPAEPDSIKRRKFYSRHGFHEANGVIYRRKDPKGNPFDMDILLWTPDGKTEADDESAYEMMTQVCEHVHNFHAKEYYGKMPADPNKVLSLETVAN